VAEEQGPARLPAGEAGAEDRVGPLLGEDREEAEQVAGVVLQVGVVDDGDLGVGAGEPGADGRALAAVAGVLQEDPVPLPARTAPRSTTGMGPGARGAWGRAGARARPRAAANPASTSAERSREESSTTITWRRESSGLCSSTASRSSEAVTRCCSL
jgi:hypothetical protein